MLEYARHFLIISFFSEKRKKGLLAYFITSLKNHSKDGLNGIILSRDLNINLTTVHALFRFYSI